MGRSRRVRWHNHQHKRTTWTAQTGDDSADLYDLHYDDGQWVTVGERHPTDYLVFIDDATYTCENGDSTPGPAADQSMRNSCQSCNTGYHIDGTACLENSAYTCTNGEATPGTAPDQSMRNHCQSCNARFFLYLPAHACVRETEAQTAARCGAAPAPGIDWHGVRPAAFRPVGG